MKTTNARSSCIAIVLAVTAIVASNDASAQFAPAPIGVVDFPSLFPGDGNAGPILPLFGGAMSVTARTMIDKDFGYFPNAPGAVGSIYVDWEPWFVTGGLGVQTWGPKIEGSTGISGGGGHQEEELVFTYHQGGAFLDSISVVINDLKWGSGMGKDDDPFIFLNTNHGIFAMDEFAVGMAAVWNGAESYTINFGAWAGLVGGPDTIVDTFSVRETNGHILVRALNAGVGIVPIPEPGSAILAMLGLFTLIIRSRRRAALPHLA